MGTFKKKKIILMSIADLTIGCTTSVKCTTADACCAKFTAVTATANVSPVAASPDICIPVGTKIATALTIAAQTGIVDVNKPPEEKDIQSLTALKAPPVPPPSPSPLLPPPPPST